MRRQKPQSVLCHEFQRAENLKQKPDDFENQGKSKQCELFLFWHAQEWGLKKDLNVMHSLVSIVAKVEALSANGWLIDFEDSSSEMPT